MWERCDLAVQTLSPDGKLALGSLFTDGRIDQSADHLAVVDLKTGADVATLDLPPSGRDFTLPRSATFHWFVESWEPDGSALVWIAYEGLPGEDPDSNFAPSLHTLARCDVIDRGLRVGARRGGGRLDPHVTTNAAPSFFPHLHRDLDVARSARDGRAHGGREPCARGAGFRLANRMCMSLSWTCAQHGPIEPLHPFQSPTKALTEYVAEHARVPVWLPWPLPIGWLVTGIGHAGEEARGTTATVVACSGPNPVGGGADLLLVAEEPTVGLGASYASLERDRPWRDVRWHATARQGLRRWSPVAALEPAGSDRPCRLRRRGGGLLALDGHVSRERRRPVAERLRLADIRELGAEVDMIPFGALSPRVHLASSSS